MTDQKESHHPDEMVLDIFGQNPRLSRLYTQLCYCFALADDSQQTRSKVIRTLTNGLDVLFESFPWLSGTVERNDKARFYVKPSQKTVRLVVRDLHAQLPSLSTYRSNGYPFAKLDEAIIAPRATLPEKLDEPAEVILLQANFIQGGLLLVIAGQHNCMDVVGQGEVTSLFAKACRGEPFSEQELKAGNMPRADAIPLLSPPAFERIEAILPPLTSKQPANEDEYNAASPQSVWCYAVFSPLSIGRLKSIAQETMTTPFVSTDDVLSGFLWQSVTRARLRRLAANGEHTTTFERQVDVRKILGLPSTYVGNAVYTTSNTESTQGVDEQPLGVVASWLRTSLNDPGMSDAARAAATRLRNQVVGGASTSQSSRKKLSTANIKMSSWAKENSYNVDYGRPLGRPDAVRRPAFPAWEGLAYLMPKKPDGEIAAALCLRSEDLVNLKANDEFARFGNIVG